jgi:hypothetical protein
MRLPFTTVFALFLTVLGAPAAVLDWSAGAVTWTAGSLSNTYSNVGGSGVNVTVAFSGNTGTLQSGSPNTTDAQIGGTGKRSLQADVLFPSSSTAGITVTITFSKAVYVQNLNILDVDASLTPGGWQDKISQIKGTTTVGQVNPVAVVGGGSAVSVTGTGAAITALGQSSTTNTSTSNVSVSFGNFQVTQISFLYSPGPNQPTSPQAQRIGLDNITFSLTPEVGPSLAATALCGLVMLARLRQEQKRRHDRKRLLDFTVS